MKNGTIDKAVKSLNKSIKFYQRKLTYQLELKAEAELHNGNLNVANFGNDGMDIMKYQIILADLATIKRAIKAGRDSAIIYGTATHNCYLYIETAEALSKAGFDTDSDGDGKVRLLPIGEWQEEETQGKIEDVSSDDAIIVIDQFMGRFKPGTSVGFHFQATNF